MIQGRPGAAASSGKKQCGKNAAERAGETMGEQFDLVIIGGGPAGYTAAVEAAGKGMKTSLIENRELGGTCLNRGCIPTKTILHAAQQYYEAQHMDAYGIHAEAVSCDMGGIQAYKADVVRQLQDGIAMLMKKNKVTVFRGTGTIVGPHKVRVTERTEKADAADAPKCEAGNENTQNGNVQNGNAQNENTQNEYTLLADYVLIATGSLPSMAPIPGTDLDGVLDSDAILASDRQYPRLTIVGGGVIGMEFASIYSALGAQVTVIEFLDRILANMDREISQNLKMILKKRGVDIHTGAGVEQIERAQDGSLVCRYKEKDVRKTVVSDAVLIATGRHANTEGLFDAQVQQAFVMDRGRIVVNAYGQTSVPNVYAVGDVTPGIQLAHAASSQGINAVAHMVYSRAHAHEDAAKTGFVSPMRTDLIPGCVYTDPEIGSIGITQDEAKAQGIPVLIRKYPMSANGKSVLTRQERGFIKVVADEASHKILGAQMMCARATDMISEFGTAIANGLTLEQMASVVRPHPTFSEGITEAVR